MSTLADIKVTLTLDTNEFYKNLNEVSKSLQDLGKEMTLASQQMSTNFANSLVAMTDLNKGMAQQTQEMAQNVGGSFTAIGTGVTGATQQMRRFGKEFRDISLMSEAYLEQFKNNFLEKFDMMNSKATTSKKIMASIFEFNYHDLSRALLNVGDALERKARLGNVVHLALQRVGRDAPFKKMLEEIKFIEQGLTRMRQVFIYMGLASVFATAGLVLLSNEVDGRLIPAFEELKKVWAEALTPFVNAFTTGLLAIMSFFTGLGKIMDRFAELHPQLSQMFWGFLYLTMVLTALLSPLAIGIGLAGGLAGAFTVLWSAVAPFVLGLLTVIGVAVLVAGAIVVLVAVINNMWKASENFRNSITSGWNKIKEAVLQALSPLIAKWEELKAKFFELIHTITGGDAHSMGDFWKWLGDRVATFVNWFVANFLPVVTTVIGGFVQILGVLMTIVGWVFDIMAKYWPQISAIIGTYIQIIKNVITSAFNVITNTIKFWQNLFKGNWSGAWENAKAIIVNALTFIVNFFMLTLGGRLLSGLKAIWLALRSGFTGAMNLMKFELMVIFNGVKNGAIGVFTGLRLAIGSVFNAILSVARSVWNAVGRSVWKPVKTAYDKVLGFIRAIKNAFRSMKITIPKPKMPKVSVSMAKNGWGIPYPKFKINWNAKGNIFNGASILGGNQGVGEAGAEAVLPIEHKRYMQPFASAIASHLNHADKSNQDSGSQYTIQFNEPVVIRENADIQRIVDEMERRKKLVERSKGLSSN